MNPAAVFEESTNYALNADLRPRALDYDDIISWSDLKIVALTGARRTGKSSSLMILAQRLSEKGKTVAYINAEDTRIPTETFLQEALKWFGDEGHLIIDEVTAAGDWQGWLARNHDLLKGRLRIVVSSSRSGLIMPPKVLRGRVRNIELFPLDYKEFLAFNNITFEPTTAGRGIAEKALEQYLTYGGFPDVSLRDGGMAKTIVLTDYFKQILSLDVAESFKGDIAHVSRFGGFALRTPYFSASKCYNYMKGLGFKIGKEKVLDMEHHAQESYLFFFVPVLGRTIKDGGQYPRKFYPVDVGFLTAHGIVDRGRVLETIVFLHKRRRLAATDEMFYWRGKTDEEVDIVIRKGNDEFEAIQVCHDMSDARTRTRETASLIKCLDELGIENGLIVTTNGPSETMKEDNRIKTIGLLDWLLT